MVFTEKEMCYLPAINIGIFFTSFGLKLQQTNMVHTRVARFFLVQTYQNGKKYTKMTRNYTKLP
jgi:Kef-type K+ transport system membrane component KefB